MTRKLVLMGLTAVFLGVLSPTLAQEKEPAGKKEGAPYVHTVIFYLNEDAPKDAAEKIIADCHKLLARIPTVRQLRVGRPAADATPDAARKDYQVGLMILFDNYAGLKTYLDHPYHVEFLNKHGGNVDMKRLQVFDFSNEKK